MFSKLADFSRQYRIIITTIWVIAAVVLFLFAPKLSTVGTTDESQFLPQDTQSASARKLLDEKFTAGDTASASSGIIVFYNAQSLSDSDMQSAKAIRDWLVSSSAPNVVEGVTSIFDNDILRATLISADQTTMMMPVNFSSNSMSDSAGTALTEIRDYIKSNYPSVKIYVTGEIGFFQDLFTSVQQTISRTTLVTVTLVAILLLIIYRSPVAALLPLIAVGCSFAVAIGIIGFLGQAGAKFSTLSEAYLAVIIFGVGTDYCLFIVSRFREELKQRDWGEAQRQAMKHIAPVIAASALTVIVAFLSMGISRFGMNQTTGYAMAIGVAITLVAGLTLIPALMALFGKHLFWPSKNLTVQRKSTFGWATIGNWVSRHPIFIAVPIIIVLLLPFLALPKLTRSADMINQMPQSSQSVQGFKVMSAHFSVGSMSPLYVLIQSPQTNITDQTSLLAIEQTAQSLSNVIGVSRVDYFSAPAKQLSSLALQVRSIGDQFGTGSGTDKIASFQSTGQTLQGLALGYPGIVQSRNFQQISLNLKTISAVASQLSVSKPENMPGMFAQMQTAAYGMADSLNGLVKEFELQDSSPFVESLYKTYFSSDKTITRINVVLSGDTYSPETINNVIEFRKSVVSEITKTSLQGSTSYVGGDSAVRADIMITNDADFGRVVGLSIAGIFVVIVILLRSLLAPLYMVVTVLLNYGSTLGIATWLFLGVMKQNSIIYMIPLFVFIILGALGADYNIFLVSRIREEAQKRSLKDAVSHAVANTGGVITACGIILTGTFAALMTAPLQVVFQIGASIAIGVIIDTFIVRALLVPSLAVIAGRWNWWPSGLFKKNDK